MPAHDLLQDVRVAPSILASDFARLGEQVETVMDAGARVIHVDVMDGHFVPPISIGSLIVEALRDLVHERGGVLDVHLMVERPERRIEDFAEVLPGVRRRVTRDLHLPGMPRDRALATAVRLLDDGAFRIGGEAPSEDGVDVRLRREQHVGEEAVRETARRTLSSRRRDAPCEQAPELVLDLTRLTVESERRSIFGVLELRAGASTAPECLLYPPVVP